MEIETVHYVPTLSRILLIAAVLLPQTAMGELRFTGPLGAGVDFSLVQVGATAQACGSVTLENRSGVEAIIDLTFSTPGNGFEADTSACPPILPPNLNNNTDENQCEVSVTFTPSDSGPAQAALRAEGIGAISGSQHSAELPLSGIGVAPGGPALELFPNGLDFGEGVIGSRLFGSFTVRNILGTGAESLTLSAIELGGDTEFQIMGGTCVAGRTLDPGNTCAVMVGFSPAGAGSFSAEAVITTDDGHSLTVDLLGGGVPQRGIEPVTERVSMTPDEQQFIDPETPLLLQGFSADGRFVVFIVEGRPGCVWCMVVYRRDRDTNTTKLVSGQPDGGFPQGTSRYASISADGRFIVFANSGESRFPAPGCERGDYYLRDMARGVTEAVLLPTTDGERGGGQAQELAFSADARLVAFQADASNLVPDDTNDEQDIFVHDRATDTVERVSVASDSTEANGWSRRPSISADGRYVAFESQASNLVSDDTNDERDIFVHDRATRMTERVSAASDGTESNGRSLGPASISADGRYVAFSSWASNLVPDDTNNWADTFVHDRATGTTERVSVASDGTEGNEISYPPSISADGRYVAFSSQASNLVPDDTNNWADTFVHDRVTGTTERVSVAHDDSEAVGNAWHDSPAGISADSRVVALRSAASNLVPGDTNNQEDIFVRDRGAEPVPAPALTFAPASLDFGEIEIGTTSEPQMAVLSNTGDETATGLNFNVPDNGFVVNTSDCANALPAGENCEVSVTFTPADPGPAEAVLEVASDVGVVAELALSGSGSGDDDVPGGDRIFEDRFETE